ncbi:Cytochrome P471 monooxygenase [Paramyrothecium foliicola]|nr:Cytochrome P471 monooxygenase [Paramyrothecium foliicola]
MSSLILAAVAASLVFLYAGYRWALPRPLPGIPYNAEATGNLLGDIPDLMRELGQTGDMVQWLLKQNLKTGSPISQIFVQPFGRPYILVSDWRAARDIMLHRSRAFDRSSLIMELFEGLLRRQQFTLRTSPEWKLHRRLVQDTMSPAFLHKMAAPTIYADSLNLIELWNMKARLADGRPFSATDDLFHATFDAVLGFTFGHQFPHSATKPQIQHLKTTTIEQSKRSLGSSRPLDSVDIPVDFPLAQIDEALEAMLQLSEIMEDVKAAPSPPLKWWFVKKTAGFRRRIQAKDRCIRAEILKAVDAQKNQQADAAASNSNDPSPSWMRCAVETIVDRERRHAQRDNRQPSFFSDMVMDEIFGFIVGGHDTMSTTLCWAVKFLADHPAVQDHLRAALQTAHGTAISEKRLPSSEEILQTSVPYLDATMEEVLRCGNTVPIGDRETTEDTTLLGHPIPKGTIVFFLHNGPGTRLPELDINRQKYSHVLEEMQSDAKAIPPWDSTDVAQFKPERWLTRSVSGEDLQFNSQAGPSMPFGLGGRACFGRRLAYVEFRILLTMVVWNFELMECPDELSSYSGQLAVVHKPRKCFVRLKRIEC